MTIDILLVEDNPSDARLVREAFKETTGKTDLHLVTNGHDAITSPEQRQTTLDPSRTSSS
ncbi:hypothetical protein [Haloprofundus halobius]|uniref:hypothetical protein n=1 Tax=Haloprofundus halobius TaxID=2876194 RepID=UPI001CCFC2D6|nr:hypothetical protein [Haloprofundus halobius]